jgi:putative acetyltransferase
MPSVDVAIRPEAPGDEEAIDSIVRRAFMQQFGSDSEVGLVRNLRSRSELVPELALVAHLADGLPIGFIAFSEVTVNGMRVGGLGLGPVAVDPDHQSLGIGGALICAGLDRATAAGWRFVVLLGHDHYYPRFGFEPAAPLGVRGDYGEGASWMVRALGHATLTPGLVQYCSAFLD